jgi:hypothetical protein
MSAAPYKVAIAVRNQAGQITTIPVTASDVNTAYWIFSSGGSELPLSAMSCQIIDVVYTAAGTDTSQVYLFVNGINTGKIIFNAANLGTVYNRQLQTSPIGIPAGALVKFQQIT